jgi:hypothetical protein
VAKPPNPTYTARPHHAKRRARQAFHLRCPDGLLSLASFLHLATTDAPAPCPRLRPALLAPCCSHFIPSATGSLEPSLLGSPLLGGPARLRHTKSFKPSGQSLITHGPRYFSTWFLNLPLDECIVKRRSKSKQELIQVPQSQ